MGLLDVFNDSQPSGSGGMAGLLSPQDKLMALFQGLTQAGVGMSQPGMGRGQALAMGLGGLGQGMQQGNQQALQQRLFIEKLAAQQKQKAAQEAFIKANPQYAGIAGAAPAEFFKTMADRTIPKQAETPFGFNRDASGNVTQTPGAFDTMAQLEALKARQKTEAERGAQNAVPLTTETPEFKARVAGATENAQQAAQMPFVGPKAASSAAASLPYDIQKAWAIPRVLPPGGQVVAGGAPGGTPAQVIMTSPNPAPGSQEGKYNAGVGELQSKTVTDWRTGAEAGFVTQQNVQRMRDAVDNGLKTGTFAPARQATVTALADLGVSQAALDKYFNAKDAKSFDAAAKELVLPVVKTLGANPTNTDRDFIEKTIPQLRDNPEAVKALLDWMDTKAQQKIDLYKEGYKHAKNSGDPLEFEQDWWSRQKGAKAASPAKAGWTVTPVK